MILFLIYPVGLLSKWNCIGLDVVTLIQVPTTRAKSPKLGRKKSPSPLDSEGNNSQRNLSGRLSLDEKISSSKIPIKGLSPAHPKKPQRKSLPKLPFEKIKLYANDEKGKLPKTSNEGNTTTLSDQTNEGVSANQEQEAVLKNEASEFLPPKEDVVVQEEAATLMNGPIALAV